MRTEIRDKIDNPYCCCRVTKFKINWDSNSTENSENIPPKTDPNQMSSENSQSLEGPLKSGGGQATRMEMD